LSKPTSEYHNDKNNKGDGKSWHCKTCSNTRARVNHKIRYETNSAFREAKRNTYIKSRHGITLIDYLEKLKAQGSQCSICSLPLPTKGFFTHLDHNHTTGKLRDFLCTNCNRGLGHFQDNPNLLHNAEEYLRRHNE
jgi:hypothetical protein